MTEPRTPQGPTPEPRVRPTNPATLVAAGFASAAIAWLIISSWYGVMPPLPWLPAITLLGLAVVEFALAQQTKARIERKPGRPPVEPLLVARYVVLAKASSLAGSIFAGFFAGLTVWLLVEGAGLRYAQRDRPAGIATVLAAGALVAAALWLERACRVPKEPDKDNSDND